MVDPIGAKTPLPVKASAPRVAAKPSVARASDAAAQTRSAAADSVMAAAKEASKQAPVDSERVAQIRKAVQSGKFPILPATIADRLIALKMQWDPHEPS